LSTRWCWAWRANHGISDDCQVWLPERGVWVRRTDRVADWKPQRAENHFRDSRQSSWITWQTAG